MIVTTIERILVISVALAGSLLLMVGIIYEDVIIAFEDGLKEYIKKALRCRKHQQRKRK